MSLLPYEWAFAIRLEYNLELNSSEQMISSLLLYHDSVVREKKKAYNLFSLLKTGFAATNYRDNSVCEATLPTLVHRELDSLRGVLML